ncbi:hypothetical protein HDU67_004583 [Dinochytrium kinnereticum]|nr:hypothetical protein HDU67_004583 [Dinochytrium kinnereticum]
MQQHHDHSYSSQQQPWPTQHQQPTSQYHHDYPKQPEQPGYDAPNLSEDYYPDQADYYGEEEDQDLLDSYRVLTLERIKNLPKQGDGKEGPGHLADQETDGDLYGGYAAITDEYGNMVPASAYKDDEGGLVILTQDGGEYYVDGDSYAAVADAAQQQQEYDQDPAEDPSSYHPSMSHQEQAPTEPSRSRQDVSREGSVASYSSRRQKVPKPASTAAAIQLDFSTGDDWATSAFDAVANETGAKPFSEEEKESVPVTVKKFHLPSTRMKYFNSMIMDMKEQEENAVLTAIREGASMPAIPAQYRDKQTRKPHLQATREDSGYDSTSDSRQAFSAPIHQTEDPLSLPTSPVAPFRSHTIDENQRAAHKRILDRHQMAAAAAIASISLTSKKSNGALSGSVSPPYSAVDPSFMPPMQHPDTQIMEPLKTMVVIREWNGRLLSREE